MSEPAVDRLSSAQRNAVRELLRVTGLIADLGERFRGVGHEVALVGGSVRDALLGRLGTDLDFATSARPDETERLLAGWADAVWGIGRAYGTVGARKGHLHLEVTTYRADTYDPASRKPRVEFGDSLTGDLHRRDFTVNAMAVTLPDAEFVDPHGGLRDLAVHSLRTPAPATESFGDDPLRMMRAARFSAQLGFDVAAEVATAMVATAPRITIVSAERVRDELVRLVCAPDPLRGLRLMVATGLADHVLPELPALRLERDEHHRHKDVYEHTLTVLAQAIALESRLSDGGPDLVTRLAALLHDIGKPATRRFGPGGAVSFHHHDVVGAKVASRRLRELRLPADVVDDVSALVGLHLRFHGYGTGEWTDSAVRRYVRDAGPLLARLHVLTRADCTTRNRRRAERLARAYDHLEDRIDRLARQEDLARLRRPDLDGNQVMDLLGLRPGPEVGRALAHLSELRLEYGPLGPERAAAELQRWWAEQHPTGV